MSFLQYREAIASISAEEAAGEDVDARIASLARVANLDVASVRHEVTEFSQD